MDLINLNKIDNRSKFNLNFKSTFFNLLATYIYRGFETEISLKFSAHTKT